MHLCSCYCRGRYLNLAPHKIAGISFLEFSDEQNIRFPLINMLPALGLSLGSAVAADMDAAKRFHDSVRAGDLKIIRSMLLAHPALATSVDEHKFQPIHLLDMYFDAEILDLLLAAGAEINAKNDEGVTLLHIITDPDAVGLLIKRGADIEAKDARG